MKKSSRINILFDFLFLATAYTSAAQQTCNCLANLDTLILKTEANYAGYPDMVKRGEHPKYKKLVKELRSKSANITDPKQCFALIKAYPIFFNDKHFDFEYSITESTKYQYTTLSEATFKNSFNGKQKDAVEGIWINPDSSTKIAIRKKSANIYQGIILESKDTKLKPGLIYYTFTKTKDGFVFDRYDWGTPDFPVRQRGNLLFVWNFEVWAKTFPETVSEQEKSYFLTWRNYNYGLNCKKLDDDNVLLTIGSFNRHNKVKELVESNDSLIRSAKHLIIDLRGNGGGNSGWTYLLPYFYTGPIDQGDTYLRLSPDNLHVNLPGMKATTENTAIDPRWAKSYTPELLERYKKTYQEAQVSKETFLAVPSLTLHADTVLPKPEKLALIVDDRGGSSTEYFFYLSKQSAKVKRYGERTFGMMDYMGASSDVKMPFGDYYLQIPDRKATWTDAAPTNITGFIPENDLRKIPRAQWIEYIKKDLSK